MTPSIKTPELQIAVTPLANLLKAADSGTADIEQGRLVIGASNSLCRVVQTDVQSRIARAKAIAIEAKQIEATAAEQPALSKAA